MRKTQDVPMTGGSKLLKIKSSTTSASLLAAASVSLLLPSAGVSIQQWPGCKVQGHSFP